MPVDLAPLEKVKPKIDAAMKQIRDIPKENRGGQAQGHGQEPGHARPGPDEMAAMGKRILAQNRAVLDKLEPQARGLAARFGHVARIDLSVFAKMRAKTDAVEKQLDETVARLKKAEEKAQAALDKTSKEMKARVKPEQLAKTGVDPDNLLATKSLGPFHDRGFPFVVACRRRLQQDPEAYARLAKLGIDRQTAARAWLGLNPEPLEEPAEAWGLPPEAGPVGLPAGLVMPRFTDRTLTRILIRPEGIAAAPSDDILVPGSDPAPLFLPGPAGGHLLRTEDELSARLAEQEAGDVCSVVAAPKPDEAFSEDAANALKTAPTAFVVLPAKTDRRDPAWTAFAGAWPNAARLDLPEGRCLTEAAAAGRSVRDIVLDALPPEQAAPFRPDLGLPAPGQPPGPEFLSGFKLPLPDIKGLIAAAIAEVNAHYQPTRDALNAKQADVIDQISQRLGRAGAGPGRAAQGRPQGRSQAFYRHRRRIDQGPGGTPEPDQGPGPAHAGDGRQV